MMLLYLRQIQPFLGRIDSHSVQAQKLTYRDGFSK